MSTELLIVSQALIQYQDGFSLHPDLLLWGKQLAACRQKWFNCADKTPLGWYASVCERSPSAVLIEQCSDLPEYTHQCWVASPYHAQLARDSVRVFPEGLFAWTHDDARHLCATLNPFLADEDMQLHAVGAALLLSCRQVIDAYPQSFGELSGHFLPDRHHEGEDGGRLNRLLSEIQMMLFQHPSLERHDRGDDDVNGLWLWAPMRYQPPSDTAGSVKHAIKKIAVATRNPLLRSIVDGRNASLMITEAERMAELIQQHAPLPKRIILAGEGQAVLLTQSILPKFGKTTWQAKAPKPESILLSILHSVLA